MPGWKTDRGRIYIVFSKPDETDSHPSGGTWSAPWKKAAAETSTFPFEDWRYRYIEGIGQEVVLNSSTLACGEFHMTLDRSKDALLTDPERGPHSI